MKIGKTYIEFISEKKSKKKSPAAQIKKLTKKQKTLIDKSKDIKDEVSKLAADKDKNPEDKLTSLLLKNKINQTEIDGQKIAIQKQQIALNSKIKGVKKKKKSMPKNEQLAAYADEISLEEGLFGWLSGVFKNPGLKRKDLGEGEFVSNAYLKEVVENSTSENDEIITETLANILLQQKNYEKAQDAYRKLSLKYPEKSVYFATRIKEIEKIKNI